MHDEPTEFDLDFAWESIENMAIFLAIFTDWSPRFDEYESIDQLEITQLIALEEINGKGESNAR